jgi:hypothetical protein
MVTQVVPGSTYDLTVTVCSEGIWTECTTAFFDWDHDGDFNNADERYELGCGIDLTATVPITIPGNAFIGETRFRVVEKYSTTTPNACESSVYGEAEDYTVLIGDIEGACCLFGNNCEQHLLADCNNLGGQYLGGGVPCGGDCDNDGEDDACELADGAPDCNTNGVLDNCDIDGGTSNDCQPDGIPDECQLVDNDCNSNGVPDDCEPGDWDGNGIPDACEGDCNSNGLVDACDISCFVGQCNQAPVQCGTSDDCNTDGLPDECCEAGCGAARGCGSLTTAFLSGNGHHGNMFDLTFFTPVTIESFDGNFDAGGAADVEVWYRTDQGSYIGHNTDPTGWTMMGAVTLPSTNPENTPTPVPIGDPGTVFEAGPTGFYFSRTDGVSINYTNGPLGEFSNDDLLFHDYGHGGAYPFNLTFSPRVWNGTIYYCPAGAGACKDCNGNGIPDDCDIRDCDGSLWCTDCNENGVPDGCDIDCCDGSTECSDCNTNGIPDECELGCGEAGCCSDPDAVITVQILTDNYGGETTWELVEQDCGVVASGGPYPNNTLIEVNVDVCSTSCYDFTIFDSFGDGICCAYGEGFYNIYYNGELVGSGGEFGSEETVADIGEGCGETGCTNDCNSDGIPDECQLVDNDCNSDGTPDDCQLEGNDCNGNQIPDDCESQDDCDSDGVLDICDADCNDNGESDTCEILADPTLDCDVNGELDECCCSAGFRAGFVYQYDDTTSENSLGLTAGGEIAWIAHYNVVPGEETIGVVQTTFGTPAFPGGSGVSPGDPFRVYIWDDPDGDGSPADAVLLAEANGTVDAGSIETDVLQDVSIGPVNITSGSFFIGASYQHAAGFFVAPMDDNGPQFHESWVDFNGPPYDPNLVGAALFMDDIGFTANWLLRAVSGTGGGGCTDCNENCRPDSCDIAEGTSLDCNSDGVPDECQLEDNDCNTNAIPDDCEIADCGEVVEECDANAWCQDCNSDGILDGCQLSATATCSLTTVFTSGNGHHGNMFDIIAFESIDVSPAATATTATCSTSLPSRASTSPPSTGTSMPVVPRTSRSGTAPITTPTSDTTPVRPVGRCWARRPCRALTRRIRPHRYRSAV